MSDNSSKKKLFTNPRWTQDPGAVPTGEHYPLTEEEKKWVKEQDEKWKKMLPKLKAQRIKKK